VELILQGAGSCRETGGWQCGVPGSESALVKLMVRSRFGLELMEGVVLRRGDGQRCKILRPGFVRAGDADIGRNRNVLALPPDA